MYLFSNTYNTVTFEILLKNIAFSIHTFLKQKENHQLVAHAKQKKIFRLNPWTLSETDGSMV